MITRVEGQAPLLTNETPLNKADLAKSIESAIELALDAVTPGNGVVPSQFAPADAQELSQFVAAFADPTALLLYAESLNRDTKAGSLKDQVHNADSRAETAEKKNLDEIEKAERAARKKNKRPKWLRKLIKAIVSIVAAAASVFSGGALTGLAVAGLILMYGGDLVVKTLVKIGILPEKAAMWISIALKVAGGIMMAAAGPQAIGEAVSKLTKVMTETAMKTVIASVAVSVGEAGADIHTAAWGKKEGAAKADAALALVDWDAALGDMEDFAAEMQESFDRYERVAKRLQEIAVAQGEARMASTQLLA